MQILEASGDLSANLHNFLLTAGSLVHRRRRCEGSHLVTLADVQGLLAHPAVAQGIILLASEGDDLQGFAVASMVGEPAAPVGRLHFFVVQPASAHMLAEQLLDHLLARFAGYGVSTIYQARLDPISGVFRVEQDRDMIALLRSRGFADGPVAGNMEADVQDFRWTDRLQSNAAAAEAKGVLVRAGRAEDVPAIQALNRAEGLPEWDYHLDATLRAARYDLLLVAEDCSDASAASHDGPIVGYANYFASSWGTELPEFGPLLVASPYRRMGLGSVLTARAVQHARTNGKQRVRLSTMANRFDFYRALGFEVTVTWQEQLWKTMHK